MSDNVAIQPLHSFHPIVEDVYRQVHAWIGGRPNAPLYKTKRMLDRLTDLNGLLVQPTFESAAGQYYVYFPPHFFKVSHILQEVIGTEALASWFNNTRHIVILDVGCGAGAASAALANTMLTLQAAGCLARTPTIFCVGIDTNLYATALYSQFMRGLGQAVESCGIRLEHKIVTQGDLEAVSALKRLLTEKRREWDVPRLTDLVVMQVNVISPFSKRYRSVTQQRNEMLALGVDPDAFCEQNSQFGAEEALAYRQIMEAAMVDGLRLITIGTDGWHDQVRDFTNAAEQEFAEEHRLLQTIQPDQYHVDFTEPQGCWWYEQKNARTGSCKFSASIISVRNSERSDRDWDAVSDLGNLRVAWARARHLLLDESLTDEIELRLFEANLDENLARLRQDLLAYAREIVGPEDYYGYGFPKGPGQVRPRGLSRLEEEILSTAIVQRLGEKVSALTARSFAYRPTKQYGEWETEYLYQNWFEAYRRFSEACSNEVRTRPGCAVLVTDIASFFTQIVQSQLVEMTRETLSRSDRIEWLLRLLLTRDLDTHEKGRGVIQGGIGSGFYANLYLRNLDTRFGVGNEWELEFFRYVDDMVFILPNPDHLDEVVAALDDELSSLGLERNKAKTIKYYSADEFLESIAPDELLDSLKDNFAQLLDPLWIQCEEYRELYRRSHYSRSGEEWWYLVGVYARCLREIGVFVAPGVLSRRIFGYLFNSRRREEAEERSVKLVFPPFPLTETDSSVDQWRGSFVEQNPDWCQSLAALSDRTRSLACDGWDEIRSSVETKNAGREKTVTRRTRYALNRLAEVGYGAAATTAKEILCSEPWLLRDHASLLESLARQGLSATIEDVLAFYEDDLSDTSEYLSAVALRAIRFLPQFPDQAWRRVARGATSGSNTIALLATETWLCLAAENPYLAAQEDVASLKLAVERNRARNPRLQKNYYLILSIYDDDPLYAPGPSDSELLRRAYEVAKSGGASGLVAYPEPELIRESFYGGARASQAYDDTQGPAS